MNEYGIPTFNIISRYLSNEGIDMFLCNEEDNYIQVNLEDIKQEVLEYEREILEKNFPKEIEEEKNLVKRLISQNDSISKAEKIYAGKLPIGFVTDNERYKQKVELIEGRKEQFKKVLKYIEETEPGWYW